MIIDFGVNIPDVQVCPNHTTPWRAFADAFFARSGTCVWKASRGFGGKSYLLAALGLAEAAYLNSDVNILGGSGAQSQNVHEHMGRFWNYPPAPRDKLQSEPSIYETKMQSGNKIRALMASQGSVRGPHPQRLRMDEIDEMDLRILDAALGQPMQNNGVQEQVVLSSTHQHANGTMTEILSRAKVNDWPVYEWCWRESVANGSGWLTQAEVDRKREQVTSVMWNTEYELQEPSPTARAIMPEKVALMFRRDLGVFMGDLDEYIEIEPPTLIGRYIHGGDWAKHTDYTIIVTVRIDVTPFRLVAFKRTGRKPWPLMTQELDDRIARFGGAAAHDATGIGDVINDYLTHDTTGNIMGGIKRTNMLSTYINAVERELVVAPYITYMENEHRLAGVNDLYGSGHLPDTISAMANAFTLLDLEYDYASYNVPGLEDYRTGYE